MNMTVFSENPYDTRQANPSRRQRRIDAGEPPLVVQILSVIAFGAFSIVGIAMAFSTFWLAGLILATVIAWTWSGSRTFGGRRNWRRTPAKPSINDLAPAVSNRRASGNTSFDAYRGEMLERLERESRDFDSFLTRLRDASDAMEFDQFMDDRAAVAHAGTTADLEKDAA